MAFVLSIILVWCIILKATCIPLDQFFPNGVTAGLNLYDDASSDEYILTPPFRILGRERDSLYVS